jgi:hypothetical protein
VAFAQITNKRLTRTHTRFTVGGEPGMRQELARGSARVQGNWSSAAYRIGV